MTPTFEGFTAQILGVLITQAVVGAIALVGLVAIVRRFMNSEFPASINAVNQRLDSIHHDMEQLAVEVRQMRRDVDRHEERLSDTRDRVMQLERRKPIDPLA
jgi:DNA repair ATPase RecN